MSLTVSDVEPLVAGDRVTLEEFVRRWEASSDIRKAELIGDIVYLPGPLSPDQSRALVYSSAWLNFYTEHTPMYESGSEVSWHLEGNAPQPDAFLRIPEDKGGKSRRVDTHYEGIPDLVLEVCRSKSSPANNQKRELYLAAGVEELILVLLREKEIHWYAMEDGEHRLIEPDDDGIYRSRNFAGLWLDGQKLLEGKMGEVLDTLQRGLRSDEHRALVGEKDEDAL